MRRRHLVLAPLAAAVGVPAFSQAQAAWPRKPVRIIVPFPAGGGADVAARNLAGHFQTAIKQTVVVDNKAGADGVLAAQEALRAGPDGHSLFMATASSLSYVPNIRKVPPYDVMREFMPLTTFVTFTFFLFVHESVPGRTLAEMVAHVKGQPGRYTYGAANSTGILAGAQLATSAGLQMVRVPYKGEAQMLPDLVSGRVQMAWVTPAVVPALLKDNKARALAVLLPERYRAMPEVPTLTEAGYPAVDIVPWGGFVVPASTPRDMADAAARELRSVMAIPDLVAQCEKVGLQVRASSADEFTTLLTGQLKAFGNAIKVAGLTQEE
jgi:tripartite-type tricarboxylate transporter receptor subunit TctC